MTEQAPLFSSDRDKLKECISFLQKKGYVVVMAPPVTAAEKLGHTPRKLLSYFDAKVKNSHPLAVVYKTVAGNTAVGLVNNHIKSRMSIGLTEEQAYRETYALVDALFELENEFNFKSPVTSITTIFSKNMSWLVNRLLERVYQKFEDELELKSQEILYEDVKPHKEVVDDLNDMLNKIKSRKVEEQYG